MALTPASSRPTSLPPSGAAGGVLDGTYPSPGLAAAVAGAALAETANVLDVQVDGTTIEVNADALRLKAGAAVNSIAKAGSTALTGAVTLTGGANVTLTQAGQDVSIAAGAAGELAYVEDTTGVTIASTNAAAPTSILSAGAVSFDGTAVIFEFFCTGLQTPAEAAASVLIYLMEGGTNLGRLARIVSDSFTGISFGYPVHCLRRFTPSAASHTYSVAAIASSTTGSPGFNAGAGGDSSTQLPMFVRITRA